MMSVSAADIRFTREQTNTHKRYATGVHGEWLGRSLWLIPLGVFGGCLWFTASGDPDYVVGWSALLASLSCLLCIALAGYRITSAVFFVAAYHLITYPIPAMMNLCLDRPAISPDLWEATPLAMLGCTVGCFSLACGILFYRLFRLSGSRETAENSNRKPPLPARYLCVSLWAILIPTLAAMMALGLYDARFYEDANN